MKVQFVFAPPKVMPNLGELGEGISPYLGALYLAGYIREHIEGLNIKITDGLLDSFDGTLRSIKEFRPNVLCVSYFTPVASSAYALVDEVKKELPGTVILLGGPHATAMPEEGLLRSSADAVVIGEGEVTLTEILRKINGNYGTIGEGLEDVDGVAFRKSGSIFFTNPRSFIKNLNEMPFPARDLIDLSKYRGWYISKRYPETTFMSSRGCPFNCVFCSNKVWKSSTPAFRLRSPENIANEVTELVKKYKLQEFFDCATDEFNPNLEHGINVCKEIIRRKIDITWKTQLTARPISEEFVKLLAESGCWYVQVGIETGNEKVLKGIRKPITLNQVVEACRLLKKYRIKVFGLFMLFNVWEENGQLAFEDVRMTENTLNFAKKLVRNGLVDYLGWSITTPYPGSKLYEIALRHNLIKDEFKDNWDAWLRDDAFIMQLPGIDQKDQARLKTKGTLLRAGCLLKSGNFSFKDFGYFAKKAAKVAQLELISCLRKK